MAQNEQLDVLGELAAAAAHEQPQQRRELEIREGKKHPPMLPDTRPGRHSEPKPSFETPHWSHRDRRVMARIGVGGLVGNLRGSRIWKVHACEGRFELHGMLRMPGLRRGALVALR